MTNKSLAGRVSFNQCGNPKRCQNAAVNALWMADPSPIEMFRRSLGRQRVRHPMCPVGEKTCVALRRDQNAGSIL
jgi:hypothetical protein